MIIDLDDVRLRRPEARDAGALYRFRNDPEIVNSLGGFSTGYSTVDILDWIEAHRRSANEVVWAIATAAEDDCIGHVGLYDIDHRVGKAEFAILIGEAAWRGRGLGRRITTAVVDYGFRQLNLRRIELSLLASNEAALRLYRGLGFELEGTQRDAQFRNGRHVDVLLMARLSPSR